MTCFGQLANTLKKIKLCYTRPREAIIEILAHEPDLMIPIPSVKKNFEDHYVQDEILSAGDLDKPLSKKSKTKGKQKRRV